MENVITITPSEMLELLNNDLAVLRSTAIQVVMNSVKKEDLHSLLFFYLITHASNNTYSCVRDTAISLLRSSFISVGLITITFCMIYFLLRLVS